jgi:uncharacterized delta-60 repeat protein
MRTLDNRVVQWAMLVITMTPTLPVVAGIGDVDTAYGNKGKHGLSTDRVIALPDGTLLESTNTPDGLYLIRTNADGQPDPSFGINGQLLLPVWSIGRTAVSRNGSVYLAGYDGRRGKMAVLRVLPAGQLDASFGDGGILTLSTARSSQYFDVSSVVALPDGGAAIVLVNYPTGDACADEVRLVRISPEGQTYEVLSVPPEQVNESDCRGWLAFYESQASVWLQPMAGGRLQLSLLRSERYFDASGPADSLPEITADRFTLPQGLRLAAADDLHNYFMTPADTDNRQIRLLRTLPDLSTDSDFGAGSGEVQVDFSAVIQSRIQQPVSMQVSRAYPMTDQRVYIGATFSTVQDPLERWTLIVRLRADGSLDTSFGDRGFVTVCGNAGFLAAPASGPLLMWIAESRGTSAIRLLDRDAPSPGAIGIVGAEDPRIVTEGTTQIVRVARTLGSAGRVSATVHLTPGTATSGGDYEDVSRVLTWEDGETDFKTVAFDIYKDAQEAEEDFRLQLDPVDGGAVPLAYEETFRIPGDLPPVQVVPLTTPLPGTDPTPASGGGGAIGWSTLALLAAMFCRSRSRRSTLRLASTPVSTLH